jgi:hypothetical protein
VTVVQKLPGCLNEPTVCFDQERHHTLAAHRLQLAAQHPFGRINPREEELPCSREIGRSRRICFSLTILD